MFLPIANVVTRQGTLLDPWIQDHAGRYHFPERILVACGLMESRLDEQSERRGTWPDVSAGLFHQAVKFAAAYGLGDGSDSQANITLVFHFLKRHPNRALEIAAQQLGRHWQNWQPDSLETLARYNRPGATFDSNKNRANIAWGWTASAAYLLSSAEGAAMYTPKVYADHGTRGGWYQRQPEGIILHGSRSGIQGRPRQLEFDGTRRYAAQGIPLGWNVTVGEDAISLHMSPKEWGWNARGASPRYLAVEFAQATAYDEISDGQVRAFVWWILTEVLPVWPSLDLGNLPMHSELPEGRQDGKSDVFLRGDQRGDDLRARIGAEIARQYAGEVREDGLSAEERQELDTLRGQISSIFNDTLVPVVGTLDQALSEGDWEKVAAVRNSLRENLGI